MEYRALLFDVDGTLLDTSEGIIAAVRHVIDEMTLAPLDEDTLLTFIGPPIQDSFQRVYGCDDEAKTRYAAEFRSLYMRDEYLLKAKPYDGIFDLLDSLRSHDIGIGIATYKREDYAKRLLGHYGFDHYTKHLFGADMAGKLTKADIMSRCLQSMGIRRASHALMVGDTLHDATGAAKLGVPFLAVSYGFGFRPGDSVAGSPCIGIADTPGEIMGYVDGSRIAWR